MKKVNTYDDPYQSIGLFASGYPAAFAHGARPRRRGDARPWGKSADGHLVRGSDARPWGKPAGGQLICGSDARP